jgi:hypothetical protein
MTVSGILLQGFLFLLAIAPLLHDVLSGHPGSMSKLLLDNLGSSWHHITGSSTGVAVGAVVLVCFIVGFGVQQLSATVAVLFNLVINKLAVLWPQAAWLIFFWLYPHSAGTDKLYWFRDEDYPRHVALDRGLRLQWEWQFVVYILTWNIFTSAVLYGIFCALLVDPSCGWVLGWVVAVLFLLGHSLRASRRMQLVHKACLERQEEKRPQSDERPAA